MNYDILKDSLVQIDTLYENFNELDKVLNIGPENIIFDSMFILLNPLVSALDAKYSSDDNWIDWFVFSNNRGESKFEAGYNDKLKHICDVSDLIWLLEREREYENK